MPEIIYTPEEQRYEDRLTKLAAQILGERWRECWPHDGGMSWSQGALNSWAPFMSLDRLIFRTKESHKASPTFCFVECPMLPWCVRLGVAWAIDPRFFIDHFRPPERRETLSSVNESNYPVDDKGFQCSRHDTAWITMRGYVNHGIPEVPLAHFDFPNSTNREHQLNGDGERLRHTSMSVYRARDSLYIVLVDQIPDWHYELRLRDYGWWQHQTIARYSGLNAPHHFTMPFFSSTRLTATPGLYQYLGNEFNRSFMAKPLGTMDVNDFLYKACLIQTQKELYNLLADVRFLQMRQCRSCQGLENEPRCLSDQRMAEVFLATLGRIKKCISENLTYELSCGASDVFVTYEDIEPCDFATLMQWAEENEIILQESILRNAAPVMTASYIRRQQAIKRIRGGFNFTRIRESLDTKRTSILLAVVTVAVPVAMGMMFAYRRKGM